VDCVEGVDIYIYRVLVEESEEKRRLEKSRGGWSDNIKTDLKTRKGERGLYSCVSGRTSDVLL
jgi:hypothetical protein